MKKNSFSVFLFLLVLATTTMVLTGPARAGVTARVDRERIGPDETVNLTVEADGAINSFRSLDTGPLKKDFNILNQSTSSNFQIVNGHSKTSKTWSIELEPKRTGRLTIPPLTLGGEKTKPLTVVVGPAGAPLPGGGRRGENAFLEVVPDLSIPAYLQSQVTIKVRLLLKSGLHLSDASLEEPTVDHARVVRLGGDLRYKSRRDGEVYQVIERKYAVIPEEGRSITIPSLHFQAYAGSSAFPNDPFFDRFMGRGRRLRAHSQELKIDVLPIPGSFPGKTWLPARRLTLKEIKGQPEKTTIKVGEPLTRVIEVEALGLTAEQLPEIDFKAPAGCKVYSDKAQRQTRTDGDLLRASLRQSVAFIPARAGTFVLPEIRIEWWDVVKDKAAEAVLPARTIKVVAGTGSGAFAGTGTSAAGKSQAPPPAKTETPTPAREPRNQNGKPAGITAETLRLWQGVSLLLGLAWLLTLVLWTRERRRNQNRDLTENPKMKTSGRKAPANRPRADLATAKQACIENHPGRARQALLAWAAGNQPENPPLNLAELAAVIGNPELAPALAELERAVYSPAPEKWEGEAFWRLAGPILKKAGRQPENRAKKKQGAPGQSLPPLYPE